MRRRLQSARFLAWQQAQLGAELAREEAALQALREDVARAQRELRSREAVSDAQSESLQLAEARVLESEARCAREIAERWRVTDEMEEELLTSGERARRAASEYEEQWEDFREAQQALRSSELEAEELEREVALASDQQQEVDAREAALQCMESAWACRVQQTFSTLEDGDEGQHDALEALRSGVAERIVDALLREDPSLGDQIDIVRSVVDDSLGGMVLQPIAAQAGDVRDGSMSCGSRSGECSSVTSARSLDASRPAKADSCGDDTSRSPSPCRDEWDSDAANTSAPLPSRSRLVGLAETGTPSQGSPEVQPRATASRESATRLVPVRLAPPPSLSLRSVPSAPHTPTGSSRTLAGGEAKFLVSPSDVPCVAAAGTPVRPFEQFASHQPLPTWYTAAEQVQVQPLGIAVRKACSGSITPHGRPAPAVGRGSTVAAPAGPPGAPLPKVVMRPPASWINSNRHATQPAAHAGVAGAFRQGASQWVPSPPPPTARIAEAPHAVQAVPKACAVVQRPAMVGSAPTAMSRARLVVRR